MTPQTKAIIVKDTLAVSVILTGLAELPQELGPIADLLPFKLHYIVAVAGVVGIIGSRVLDRVWQVSKSTGFIDLGAEPASVAADAGKTLPKIPPVPASFSAPQPLAKAPEPARGNPSGQGPSALIGKE